MDTVVFIRKEELIKVIYSEEEVLKTEEERKFRLKKIKASTIEHNGNRIRIAFESQKHGVLGVKSEIIGLTNNYVILKGGHPMPIKAIYKLD